MPWTLPLWVMAGGEGHLQTSKQYVACQGESCVNDKGRRDNSHATHMQLLSPCVLNCGLQRWRCHNLIQRIMLSIFTSSFISNLEVIRNNSQRKRKVWQGGWPVASPSLLRVRQVCGPHITHTWSGRCGPHITHTGRGRCDIIALFKLNLRAW